MFESRASSGDERSEERTAEITAAGRNSFAHTSEIIQTYFTAQATKVSILEQTQQLTLWSLKYTAQLAQIHQK